LASGHRSIRRLEGRTAGEALVKMIILIYYQHFFRAVIIMNVQAVNIFTLKYMVLYNFIISQTTVQILIRFALSSLIRTVDNI
jgi:hypothetical protein